MEVGTYTDLAAVRVVEDKYWRDSAVRFGDWEFRPAVCEVWNHKSETVIMLTIDQAYILKRLIAAWPEFVHPSKDVSKTLIKRLRARIGVALIPIDRRGYRFNPEAVL